jgi:hypothetical protein
MPPFGTVGAGDLVTASLVLHPLLTAGTQYWLVLSVPNDGSSAAAWNFNTIGDTGPFLQTNNGVPTPPQTQTRGAMQINGVQSVVPEPTSIVMASTAVVLILGCKLRRRLGANAA